MAKLKNLLGLKFNYLTVIEYAGLSDTGKAKWKVRCVCGNENVVSAANLTKKGRSTQSCGCMKGNRVYGPMPRFTPKRHRVRVISKEKRAWESMWNRCTVKGPQWKDYGGRGIFVHPLFESFEEFKKEVGECPQPHSNYSLGRIRNDESYVPGNLRWETRKQQQNNTRFNHILEYKGRKQTITQWAEELGLNKTYISHRLARGWSVERAIEYPIITRK